MSSIAHTQPRTGRRNFNLRAYLAGTAATAALIGAVVLAFASLGAYVAFNGLPIGGSDVDASASSVAVDRAIAPQPKAGPRSTQDLAAANAQRSQGAPAASAAGNESATNNAQPPAVAGGPATTPTSTGSEPPVATTDPEPTATPTPTQSGPSNDPPSDSLPAPQVTTPDSVGGTVGTVEQTLHDAGVNVPLTGSGSAVDDVTGLVGGN